MDTGFGTLALARAHEHKLIEAVDVLEQARALVTAARDSSHSGRALGNEARQARPRSRELLSDAVRLTVTAQRLIAEAASICGERSYH